MGMTPQPAVRVVSASGAIRGAALFLVWLALIGSGLLDMLMGVIAAAVATWVSLTLLPPAGRAFSPAAMAKIVLRFPGQSLLAGIDVARRAFSPRLPLQPGFITYETRLPPGPSREAFRALMSLQPGTLPVGETAEGAILIHCLDTAQPVAAQFAAEEALFTRMLGSEASRG